MNPTDPYTLDANCWDSTFPWLKIIREERETPGRLNDQELDLVAVSIARCAIENENGTPLDELFPTLPPSFELESLAWPSRHRNVLRRLQLVTASDLGTITIARLLATRAVSSIITEAILVRLARAAMSHGALRDLDC